MDLLKFGFDSWFQNHLKNFDTTEKTVVRLTAVNRDNFNIIHATGEAAAELTGKLLFTADSSEQVPAVGDWMLLGLLNEGSLGIIHEVRPRKSLLKRKKAGKD